MAVDPFAVTTGALAASEEPEERLVPGTVVGRYLVVAHIGAGGMGSVYSAYDPRLDRRIALKTLHSSSLHSDSLARRVANEAMAMARLSHPHVVTVHDVLVTGDRVLIAMELVEGVSLREWLTQRRRTWRDVVAMFAQAGRGLAAAHDAGIVHRDFKPDNVLVGHDRRARVADFGLSRAMLPPQTPSRRAPGPGDLAGDETLGASLESSIVGTPRYMAPEQIRGERAGPSADQFGFSVSLWEALYGVAPFAGTDLLEILANAREGKLQEGDSKGAPGWLRKVVARGLGPAPADRYPSMTAMVDALERDPGRARRRRIAAGAAAVAVAMIAGDFALHRTREARTCQAIERRLDGVWDAEKRGRARDAFLATGRAYAADTFERTAQILDGYAAAWRASAVASCERGADPEPTATRRTECYSDRLTELRALVGVLTRANSDTLEHAVHAARALPAVDTCGGRDPLGDLPQPGDPAVRAAASEVDADLRVIAALRAAGAVDPVRAAADVARAEQVAFGPLTAQALVTLGELQSEGKDPAAAEATLTRAAITAEGAGAPRAAARAWLDRASLASNRGDYAVADERFDFATAWVDRLGDDALRGELLLLRGERLSDGGDNDRARPLHREALALLDHAGSDLAIRAVNDLGVDADLEGKYEEARGFYRDALDRYERTLGPDHPSVAIELNNLGLMAADQGHLDEASASLERARRIQVSARGADHPLALTVTWNLAILYTSREVARYAEAIALAEPAAAAAARIFGPDNPNVAYPLAAMVGALLGLHRAGEAVDVATRELAIRGQPGVAPVHLADAQADLGFALLASKRDVTRGRALLEEAREGFVSVGRPQRIEDIDAALR